ncbi:MAG: Putative universal stress protein A [Clostridia bacterium 62_21]|nr:MAG: Putative universal stress protein A [Clostridia bacterium 62_21]
MITVVPSDRFPYRLIAAATDGSPNSLDAVRHAAGLAALMGARLAVVYVVDAYLSFRMGVHRDMAVETLRADGARALEEATAIARAEGVEDAEAAMISGHPKEAILAWTKKMGADLLVVGSHGYSGLATLLLGSVAAHLVRHAPCPVLVVRPSGES